MIAKVSCVSSIKVAIDYADDVKKGAEVISTHLLLTNNVKDMHKDFYLTQRLNRRCVKNVISAILSFSPNNNKVIDKVDLKNAVERFTKELNLENHQHVAIVHRDKRHIHLHIYYNRINLSGKAYNDSMIGYQSGEAAHKISHEFGWISSKDVKAERLNTTKDLRKKLHVMHKKIISDVNIRSIADYVSAFAKANVEILAIKGKAGKINGFRFNVDTHSFKASEIHRDMSYIKLCNIFYKDVASKSFNDSIISGSITIDSINSQHKLVSAIDEILENKFGLREKESTDLNISQPQISVPELHGIDEDLDRKKKKKKKLKIR